MRKLKVFFLMIVVILALVEPSIAYASEDLTVVAGNMVVRELTEAEMDTFSSAILGNLSENTSFPIEKNASYTAYEYSRAFDFYLGDTWVAQANAVCTVWHYTDGKVHLYHRTITAERLASYDIGRTYGSIVNTDGSLSYTVGDRIHIYGITNTWDFAIDFRVTPTEASFDCYEV